MAPLTSLTTTTVDNTLGAAFLGVVAASILYGSTFAQTYMYYHNYPQDSIFTKCSVGILWLLDTLHLAFIIHAIYYYNVSNLGNLLALQSVPLSLKLQALINVVIVLLVHSLYAHRAWILGGYHGGVLGYLVAFVVCGGAVVGFVLVYVMTQTFMELEESAWAVYAALGTSTSIDFVIAAVMCYYLRKSKGSITRLNSKISKVIQYMVSSGLFTSACSLAAMFSYILMPNTYICLSLAFIVTKLYAGSFLAMLNSRERTNKRVSELFNTTPNTSWRRSLKIVTNSSASLFGPTSDMSGEATIQVPAQSVMIPQKLTYTWNSSV